MSSLGISGAECTGGRTRDSVARSRQRWCRETLNVVCGVRGGPGGRVGRSRLAVVRPLSLPCIDSQMANRLGRAGMSQPLLRRDDMKRLGLLAASVFLIAVLGNIAAAVVWADDRGVASPSLSGRRGLGHGRCLPLLLFPRPRRYRWNALGVFARRLHLPCRQRPISPSPAR